MPERESVEGEEPYLEEDPRAEEVPLVEWEPYADDSYVDEYFDAPADATVVFAVAAASAAAALDDDPFPRRLETNATTMSAVTTKARTPSLPLRGLVAEPDAEPDARLALPC